MDNKNLLNFRKTLKSMNDIYNNIYHANITLPLKKRDVKKYYNGLYFIVLTLWKIYLIRKCKDWDYNFKIKLIKNIPNPDGKRFISTELAIELLNKSKNLNILFKKKNMSGGTYIVKPKVSPLMIQKMKKNKTMKPKVPKMSEVADKVMKPKVFEKSKIINTMEDKFKKITSNLNIPSVINPITKPLSSISEITSNLLKSNDNDLDAISPVSDNISNRIFNTERKIDSRVGYTKKRIRDIQNKVTHNKLLNFIISPLSTLEYKYGTIVSISLDIVTFIITMLGTITQLIGSTLTMVPPYPGLSALMELFSEGLEFIHVLCNNFLIFFSISRGNWDLAVKSAIGMFPQLLELINGMGMTLNTVNGFMRNIDNTLRFVNEKSDQIIPILQPIAKHPIKFLNPMYMYKILKLR